MALFDDILNGFDSGPGSLFPARSGQTLPPAEGPPPGQVLPPAEAPPGQTLPPFVPPPIDFGPLEDIGLLPIFNDNTLTFQEAQSQLPDLLENFDNTDLAQHFVGLVGPGREADLFRLARFLMPFDAQFSRGLLSSNPFVSVGTGQTSEELRLARREIRRVLGGGF